MPKKKFNLGTEIRAIARERIGQPKPKQVIRSKRLKTKGKAWDKLADTD